MCAPPASCNNNILIICKLSQASLSAAWDVFCYCATFRKLERGREEGQRRQQFCKNRRKKNLNVFSWIHSGAAHRFFMSHPSDSPVFCHLPQLAALSVQLPRRKSEKNHQYQWKGLKLPHQPLVKAVFNLWFKSAQIKVSGFRYQSLSSWSF